MGNCLRNASPPIGTQPFANLIRDNAHMHSHSHLSHSGSAAVLSTQPMVLFDSMSHMHQPSRALPVMSTARANPERVRLVGLLLTAAAENDVNLVRDVLSSLGDQSTSACDYDKRTALHLACAEGHREVCELLLMKGANINAVDRFGETPLHCAVIAKQDNLCEFLRLNGGVIPKESHFSLEHQFLTSAASGDLVTMKRLADAGINVDSCDYDKRTALHVAVSYNNIPVVRFLLERGCQVNSCDNFEQTPLDCALQNRNKDLIAMLRSAGAVEKTEEEHTAVDVNAALALPSDAVVSFLQYLRNKSEISRDDKQSINEILDLLASGRLYQPIASIGTRLHSKGIDESLTSFLETNLGTLRDVAPQRSSKAWNRNTSLCVLPPPDLSLRAALAPPCAWFSTSDSIEVLSHTAGRPNSTMVPPRTPEQVAELRQTLHPSKLDSFDKFDVFAVSDLTANQPLEIVTTLVMARYALRLQHLKFDQERLGAFLRAVQAGYRTDADYHTAVHAADVVQTVHSLVLPLVDRFEPLEIAAIIVAAAIHDYAHPGVNNAFLIENKDPTALTYNDSSVLENFHASQAFCMMYEHAQIMNFIEHLDAGDQRRFRSLVVEYVLATDMSHHLALLSQAKNTLNIASNGLDYNDPAHRTLAMKLIIKCADVSNPAKNFCICSRWALIIQQEFFKQGDREAALNLPISPMMDRNHNELPKSQVNFISYLVMPLYQQLQRFHPHNALLTKNLEENLRKWRSDHRPVSAGLSSTTPSLVIRDG